MSEHLVALEPRHLQWLALPGKINSLVISDPMRLYCNLVEPSDDLARHALWEAVQRYLSVWGNDFNAPSLQIRVFTK